MWHFEGIHPPKRRVEDEEKVKSPKSRRERALLQSSPPAVIYQVYGKDVAGKWFDLNQWTLPSISLPEHIIAKVGLQFYVQNVYSDSRHIGLVATKHFYLEI